jgi:hypothetical protein
MPIVVDGRYLEEVLKAIHDGHRIIFQLLAVDYVQLFGPAKTNKISRYKLLREDVTFYKPGNIQQPRSGMIAKAR